MSTATVVISILLAAALLWLVAKSAKSEWELVAAERKFDRDYRQRSRLSDEEMIDLYFRDSGIDPAVAIKTRAVFAELLQYERERLLPDDDFLFIFAEIDCIEIVMEIEEEFDVQLSDDDLTSIKATIRGAAELVQRKLNAKGSNLPVR